VQARAGDNRVDLKKSSEAGGGSGKLHISALSVNPYGDWIYRDVIRGLNARRLHPLDRDQAE